MPEARRKATDARADAGELVKLVKAYVLQETVAPLKGMARSVAFGTAAGLFSGIALVLMLIALLRALQTETGTFFAGQWNWAPYVLTMVAATMVIGIAGGVVVKGSRSAKP